MLIAIIALWSLLLPLAYLTLMVIVWACTADHRKRYLFLAAMSVPPIGLGANTALQLQDVNAAEVQFNSLCAALEKPTINATAQNVTAVFFDMWPPQGASADAAKHAALALPVNELRQSILQGSSQYSMIEHQFDSTPLRIIEADPRSRTISPGTPSSTHTVLWKSISVSSKFVTKGTLAVKESASDSTLAELSLIQLHSPAITLLGDGPRALRLVDEKNRTCPGVRSIAQLIKSVARPVLKRMN